MISTRCRVIDDECKFSFWYIEVFAYHVCSLVHLCCSFLGYQTKLVLILLSKNFIGFCMLRLADSSHAGSSE